MEYQIIFSSRKTLCAEVKLGGQIFIRAPKGTSKKKIELFIKKHEKWLKSAQEKQIDRSENKYHKTLSKQEIVLLKAAAKEYIPPRVKYYSEIMGLFPSAVKISSATKKFGSCSGKNSLNFSYKLMLYPKDVIDYVIIHEISHIMHHNHSKDFYKLIEKFMPDFRNKEYILKE